MRTSETITSISEALLKAQQNIEGAKKNATNPHFRSSYADLEAVINACKEELNKAGVVILQSTADDPTVQKSYIETTFIHAKSGEWMSSDTEIVVKEENNPQAYGSAITYARRYGLMAMALLAPEDDDGNAASKKPEVTTGTGKSVSNVYRPPKKDTLPDPEKNPDFYTLLDRINTVKDIDMLEEIHEQVKLMDDSEDKTRLLNIVEKKGKFLEK